MAGEKFNLVELVNNDGCFDLQFRKDTRRERLNSPTYYRWKAQFVSTAPKGNMKFLEKLRNLPENKKKIILWTIIAVLGLIMGYFWVNNLINTLNKLGQ